MQNEGSTMPDCRCDSSGQTFLFITDKGGTIDSDRTRCGFCDHRDVHHLIVSDPLLLFHTGILYQGDHGISSAKSKKPDFGERQKKIKHNIHTLISAAVVICAVIVSAIAIVMMPVVIAMGIRIVLQCS